MLKLKENVKLGESTLKFRDFIDDIHEIFFKYGLESEVSFQTEGKTYNFSIKVVEEDVFETKIHFKVIDNQIVLGEKAELMPSKLLNYLKRLSKNKIKLIDDIC